MNQKRLKHKIKVMEDKRETRTVSVNVELLINEKLDKKELAFMIGRIEKAIQNEEKAVGFVLLKVDEIPFKEFQIKIGLDTFKCKGDRTKTEDEALKN